MLKTRPEFEIWGKPNNNNNYVRYAYYFSLYGQICIAVFVHPFQPPIIEPVHIYRGVGLYKAGGYTNKFSLLVMSNHHRQTVFLLFFKLFFILTRVYLLLLIEYLICCSRDEDYLLITRKRALHYLQLMLFLCFFPFAYLVLFSSLFSFLLAYSILVSSVNFVSWQHSSQCRESL